MALRAMHCHASHQTARCSNLTKTSSALGIVASIGGCARTGLPPVAQCPPAVSLAVRGTCGGGLCSRWAPTPRLARRRSRAVQVQAAFIESYEAAAATSPVVTKSLTSLFGFVVADVVAQLLSNQQTGEEGLDLQRLFRTGLFGCFFYGPVSGAWYGLLDDYVMPDAPTSASAVALKVLADQLLWAPVLVTCFFTWDLVWSEEEGLEQLPQKVRDDLLATLLVNWTFWPTFHILNFRFVPSSDRILYVNVVQVFYNVFLCWQAAKRSTQDEEKAAQQQ